MSASDKLSSQDQAEPFQARVAPWMDATFGAMISGDKEERAHRFLEEALELVQSTGTTASEAHQLVDYVFGRPVGETHQEVGGVMVTLAALCLAHALDMHEAGETELARCWTKVEQIRAKQASKPKHSPLPEHVADALAEGQVPELYTIASLTTVSGGGRPQEIRLAFQNSKDLNAAVDALYRIAPLGRRQAVIDERLAAAVATEAR